MPVPNIPANYLCPITVQIMLDPVIAEDGCTYEREAIEQWFNNGHNTSPIGHGIIGSVLISNRDKKFDIMQFLDNHANFIHEAIKSSTPEDDNLEFINALIKRNKANLDRQDTEGQTPLHTSVIYRKINIIQLLLQAGADYKIRNNQHKTPKREAKEHEFWDIVNTIELEIKSISLTKLVNTRPKIDEFSHQQSIPNYIEIMQYEAKNRDSIVELEETARKQIKTELDIETLTHQMQLLSVSRRPQRYLRLFTLEMLELLALGTAVIGASAITYQYKKLNEQSKTNEQLQNQLTKLQWEQQLHSQGINGIDTFQRQMLAWKDTVDTKLANSYNDLHQINSYMQNELITSVAYGEQEKVEHMLRQNPRLAIMPGNIKDCAGRYFTQITPLQYAVWALDWHMWKMILKYLSKEEVKRQIESLNNGKWVAEHGVQVSWQNLINALQKYSTMGNAGSQAMTVWSEQVGGAQLQLPAHVIQEYMHRDRSFDPCPKFTETFLPRNDVEIWYRPFNANPFGRYAGRAALGINAAWSRSSWVGCCRSGDWADNYAPGGADRLAVLHAGIDALALKELLRVRQEQAQVFISELSSSPRLKLRI